MNYTSISSGEQKLITILRKEKIPFEREKTFSNLKKGKYRFDFYLPTKNILIEFDGAQHFHKVSFFHKKYSDFTRQQYRDRAKNVFCLVNHYRLYRIPYWEIDNIHTFSDILNEKFRVVSKWHNDLLKEAKI